MKILAMTSAAVGVLALAAGTASAQTPNATKCHNQALAAAEQVPDETAGGIIGGVAGGVLGAVTGGIIGQGKGAKIAGGAIGAVGGAAAGANIQGKKRKQIYNQVYGDCMNIATPVYYEIPPAGSQQWVYECSIKYKSFIADPNSPYYGTFQPYRDAYGNLPPRQPCQLP